MTLTVYGDGTIIRSGSTTTANRSVKITPPRSGQRGVATPHPSAQRTGMRTPVALVLEDVGGGWVRVTHRQQAWVRPWDHNLIGLLMECIQGGHRLGAAYHQPEHQRKVRRARSKNR
jgi:hypothetical protein